MKSLLLTLSLISILGSAAPAESDLAVIVNKDSELHELSKRQVVDIYMGKTKTLPSGKSLLVLDLPEQSNDKELFYRIIVGKDLAQVNAYRARLYFSGRVSPPKQARSDDIIDIVLNNKNAIGYIRDEFVKEDVRIVFHMAEPYEQPAKQD